MAAVFDIELHDVDDKSPDQSDAEDVIDVEEVSY